MNVRNTLIATLFLITAVASGCAGDPNSKPAWVAASDVDFTRLDTFGWERDIEPATIVDTEIRQAIRTSLAAKGYEESSSSPDFLVSHETLERDAIKQGNPVRIGIGVGSWGGNVGGSVGTSVDVGEKDHLVHELQVAVRMLDSAGEREIWSGTTGAMPERPVAEAVSTAISDLLAAYPARGANAE